MPSRSNALRLEPSSLAWSAAIHLALVAGYVVVAGLPGMSETAKDKVELEVFEAPIAATQPIQKMAPAAPKPKTQPRQVFGLPRKSITSDAPTASDDVSVKAGNTVAKAPDNEKLRADDTGSLPIPTEEYLVSKMPELIAEARVPYPPEAKKKGVEGAVAFDLLIDAQGGVRQSSFVSGPGFGLNEAAAEAVKRLRFKPAEVDGKPVAVRIRYAYRFVLEKG